MLYMEKRVLAEGAGRYENGQWNVKNLKFLTEFMKKMGLTTGDLARVVGLMRASVTRWFMVDDTSYSKVEMIANHYGYEFYVHYEIPDVPIERTKLSIDQALYVLGEVGKLDSRLNFLRLAIYQAGITKSDFAKKLGLSRMGLNLWFQKDDITFRYIYEIAEKMDWTVNIQFKLKEKKED